MIWYLQWKTPDHKPKADPYGKRGRRRVSKYHRWKKNMLKENYVLMEARNWPSRYMKCVLGEEPQWGEHLHWIRYTDLKKRASCGECLIFGREKENPSIVGNCGEKILKITGEGVNDLRMEAVVWGSFYGPERALIRMIKKGKFNFLAREVFQWFKTSVPQGPNGAKLLIPVGPEQPATIKIRGS